jgi:subtilisin family serine protease/outer membrane lipoprotein-sorting protein
MRLFKLFTVFLSILCIQNGYPQSAEIKVKFTEEFVQRIETSKVLRNQYGVPEYGISGFDSLNNVFSVQELERVFPYSPRFEKRHRKHGLHRWYRLKTKVPHADNPACIVAYEDCAYIERAEVPLEKKFFDGYQHPSREAGVLAETDDPLFGQQWHFENAGQTDGMVGADIDLKKAWDIQQGSPEVVVAIIDGGLDIYHEDLADNLWINTIEENGQDGIDDDGNGYIDDIHGYGFADHAGNFFPDYHGVHVGGTVAAVNNNGIGVSGVAGGSGAGDGVRIMSCAVFSGFNQDGFDQAFVYAADNGAIIAQNSWGYSLPGVFEQSVLDAIDYFIANAGYDENGDPIGLMQGGLVVFAAGNEDSSADYYPGYYARVMAVASTDHNDVRSDFSNYGSWVDIAAPGSNVFSTFPYNTYQHMSGTSMACPHVSGVAALIVSEFGGTGYTPDRVWGRLLGTTESIDAQNDTYVGLLGSGRLNAFNALQTDDGEPPSAIDDLAVIETAAFEVTLSWTAADANAGDGTCAGYDIWYATFPIDQSNFNAARRVANPPLPKQPGETEIFEVTSLEPSTIYYFAIAAYNLYGSSSAISNVVQTTTTDMPEIHLEPDSLVAFVDPDESAQLNFTLSNVGKEVLEFQIGINPPVSDSHFPGWPQQIGKADRFEEKEWKGNSNDVAQHGNGNDGMYGYGYAWIDSRHPRGPSFSWHDISGSGIRITDDFLDDNIAGPYPLGFDFPFYENIYDEFYISSNGFIRFGASTESGCCAGRRIPVNDEINNIIAWAWRNGYPTGNVFIQHYNDKVIVQFVGYGIRGRTGSLTASVIIHNDGSLQLNYLSLNGAFLDGIQTVGIENEDGTDGLQIAFEEPYLTDSLTISISRRPEFITAWSPHEGSLEIGESAGISLDVSALGLDPGNYEEHLFITSNDPINPEKHVYVLLHVNGSPEIEVDSESIDFGKVFVTHRDSMWLVISNPGTDTLIIDRIETIGDQFTICSDPRPLLLESGHTADLCISFHALSAGVQEGKLEIYSNDSNNNPLIVELRAETIEMPKIKISPQTFFQKQATGKKTSQVLTISNEDGASKLYYDFQIQYSSDIGLTRIQQGTVVDSEPGIAMESKLKTGHTVPFRDGFESGSFDQWKASSNEGIREVTNTTAAEGKYSFRHQSVTDRRHKEGIELSLEKGSRPEIISFYVRSSSEEAFDGYFVVTGAASTGIMFMTQSNGRFFCNEYSNGDASYAYNENEWYHIVFRNIDWEHKQFDYYVNGELVKADISFRNTLYLNSFDKIELYNYSISEAWWDDIKIGTEPFRWLKPEILSDSIDAGADQSIEITFDSDGLHAGLYEANLDILTNDPENKRVTIPIELEVTDAPKIDISTNSIDMGDIPIGLTRYDTIRIVNTGTDSLKLLSQVVNSNNFVVNKGSLQLHPEHSGELVVSYTATALGEETGQLIISSNDPDGETHTIQLTANGIKPPSISISTESLKQKLNYGTAAIQTIDIDNSSGEGALYWSFQIDYEKNAKSAEADQSATIGTSEPHLLEDVSRNAEVSNQESSGMLFPLPYKDGFETGDFDQWEVGRGIGLREITGSTAAEGRYSFHYKNRSSSQHYDGIKQSFEDGSRPESISFYVRSSSTARADGYFIVRQGISSAIWFFTNDEGYFHVNASSTSGDKSFAYEENTWYHIAFEDIDWVDKDFDYYVNGELIKADIPLRNSRTVEQFDGLYLYNWDASEAWWDEIKIGDLPLSWLKPGVMTDKIPPGAAQTIPMEFASHGLAEGVYNASLQVAHNDPAQPTITIPVEMDVVAVPNINLHTQHLDFGNLFVGDVAYDSVIISNSGTDSLIVTNIMIDNDHYTIQTPSRMIAPNQYFSIPVSYSPLVAGNDNATLHIESNDPAKGPLSIPITGEGSVVPVANVMPESISEVLYSYEVSTETIDLSNTAAASSLRWEVRVSYLGFPGSEKADATLPGSQKHNENLQTDSFINDLVPLTTGDFHELSQSPANLTCLAIDPSTRLIYGQAVGSTNYYKYDIDEGKWSPLASAPIPSWNNGGATVLNGRVFTCYAGIPQLGIYNIDTDTWTSEGVPINSGNITTDGTYLYFANKTGLFRYDIEVGTTVQLPDPIYSFEAWGGLEYHDGYLYGHVGNGRTDFQRYGIEANQWQELANIPDGAVLGSGLDVSGGVYFAYGNYGESNLYAYNIEDDSWSTLSIPFFSVNDGGLVYHGRGEKPGIYLIEGEAGPGFARYETTGQFSWLDFDVRNGVIEGNASQPINLHFDAKGLKEGIYQANLNFLTNAPSIEKLVFPITLQVLAASPPIIEDQYFTVQENKHEGHEIGLIEAEDAEGDPLVFHISQGNLNQAFELDAGGMLRVKDSVQFDYELTKSHGLTVVVSDGVFSDTATVTVEVSDVNEAPKIENQDFLVDENAAKGHVIGQIVAEDAEEDDLSFSIVQGNESGAFALTDPGALSVSDPGQFDYEQTKSHGLTVVVSDGVFSDTATVTVEVSDVNEAPKIENQDFLVDENAAEGHVIGQIVAEDAEEDDLSFSIVQGNESGAFALTDLGALSVSDPGQFDYEQSKSHGLTVVVSDGVFSDTATVTVEVSDVNEAPKIENQDFLIDENAAEGHVIGQIVAEDAEEDDLSFSIVQGNESGAFALTDLGALSVSDPGQFDYEQTKSHGLTVVVSDGVLGDTALIDVELFNLPELSDQTFTVEENVPRGFVIGVLDAGIDAMNLVYDITSGDPNQSFAIDNEGKLTVLDSAAIDYELAEEHRLVVRVAGERSSSQANVTVVVIDLDDVITALKGVPSSLRVYPNPSSGYLIIESPSLIKSLSIVNAVGKVVELLTNIEKANDMLDIRHLAEGSYYLIVETEDHTATRRFIKL